ncbi:TetR/AcrR family transcriptional regulator [Kribbella sp. NPDC056861]|uniref:TetR/AcrR family transcriptional regulator n=1 Tax=Kribbella sp. NPDC056861 TaxID=3154857 RepID=UPI003445C47A
MSPSSRGRPRGSDTRQLLDLARELFTEQGFRGTTMDAVAARAHVSKQSLYRDYPSKDELYSAVVRDWVERGSDGMKPHAEALAATDDAHAGLLGIARIMQAGILSPPVLQMRTLIAAEASRFPEIAADYVERSWTRNIQMLAKALRVMADRGLLQLDNPELAAEQLTWLVIAAPLNRLTLQAGAAPYSADELAELADQGVATFISRFGPAGSARVGKGS